MAHLPNTKCINYANNKVNVVFQVVNTISMYQIVRARSVGKIPLLYYYYPVQA